PLASGRVQLGVDRLTLVAGSGAIITAHRSLTLTITVVGSTRTWAVPRAADTIRATTASVHARADVDGDGAVTIRDAQALRQAWADAALTGAACPPPPAGTDADGDGCLTVADLETVAAHVRAPSAELARGAVAPNVVATFVVNSNGDGADVKADGI